jgi:hypothetical protein
MPEEDSPGMAILSVLRGDYWGVANGGLVLYNPQHGCFSWEFKTKMCFKVPGLVLLDGFDRARVRECGVDFLAF